MATIYLTGYKNSNLGDDLFFVTVLKRYPKEHFIFEDISSGYYAGLFKDFDNVDVIPSIQDSYIQRIINRIKRITGCNIREQYYSSYRRSNTIKADVYLKIGGSVFIQPEKDVRAVKDQFLSDHFYFGGIPFFYIGCNFGPFSSPDYFKNAEYVVRNCDGICFRDSYSYNLLSI
jgi:colanic acid/amylovoran biosynthesis protein